MSLVFIQIPLPSFSLVCGPASCFVGAQIYILLLKNADVPPGKQYIFLKNISQIAALRELPRCRILKKFQRIQLVGWSAGLDGVQKIDECVWFARGAQT